ncbi:MAG: hypothetical protein AAF481_07690 [Acidobacteriota bacterium]
MKKLAWIAFGTFAVLLVGTVGATSLAVAAVVHSDKVAVSVQEDGGDSFSFVIPAALVGVGMSTATHFMPEEARQELRAEIGPYSDDIRSLASEFADLPDNATLVTVRDGNDRVRVRTENGAMVIDVEEPGTRVHVEVPMGLVVKALDFATL